MLLFPELAILARRLDSVHIAVLRPNKFFNHYWAAKDYWDGSDRPPFGKDATVAKNVTVQKEGDREVLNTPASSNG